MRKLERLRIEALKSCNFRGHKMERFSTRVCFIEISSSKCKLCHKQVVINSKPQPNDIEIGGEAVALGCND